MSDLPNPNSFKSHPDVQKAEAAVKDEKAALEDLKDELEQTRQSREEAKEALADRKADARVGDASESDVDEARGRLEELGQKEARLQDEIETTRRAIEKLEGKRRQKENRAKAEIEDELRTEYRKRLKTAIQKLREANEAVQAAGEVGAKARSKRMMEAAAINDHPTSLVEGNLDHETMEVGVLTGSGSVRYTANELESTAKQAGLDV